MRLIYLVLLGVSLSLFMSSCLNDADCRTKSISKVTINFRKIATGRQDTVVFNAVQIRGIEDTVFYNFGDTLRSPRAFPLDPDNDNMEIMFRSSSGTDVLKLTYDVVPSLLGEDCGVILEYRNLKAEFSSAIPGSGAYAEVVDDRIEEEIETNVNIFQ